MALLGNIYVCTISCASDRVVNGYWPDGPICVFPIGYRPSARIAHVAATALGAKKLPGCCGGQDHRPPTLESSAQKVGTARGVPKIPPTPRGRRRIRFIVHKR